ncbi:endoglucanase E-5 [Abditibacteriota bacterium]|nr:endoglucanase E-5 [Abditibacteriota bacterium]
MRNIYTQRDFAPSLAKIWFLFAFVLFSLGLSSLGTSARADVRYQTTQSWTNGFSGSVTITNPGATDQTQWQLAFDLPSQISSIWDATLVSHTGNRYVVKSAGWNDTIAAKGQVVFGFVASTTSGVNSPTNFSLTTGKTAPTATPKPIATPTPKPQPTNTPRPGATPTSTPVPTATPKPAATGVHAVLTRTNGWNGGFGASLDILNDSPQTINGWTLKFTFEPQIDSLWNGNYSQSGHTYTVTNVSWNGTIAPGGKATIGFSATGELAPSSISAVTLNGTACPTTVVLGGTTPTNPSANGIVIGHNVDANGEALQITIPQGVSTFPLTLSGDKSGTFSVASNNPTTVGARVLSGSTLELTGLKAGRAGLRLEEAGGARRYIGVRVKNSDGSLPGWPSHLSLGSVSEDTDDHLNFWHSFGTGATNRYVDARYIYLNGGPQYGWATWTNTPGGRAISYIRESKKMGMLPIFVWYNIPDGGESYDTDMSHIQSAAYMKDYYKLLQLFLDVVKQESPDEPVGVILEPDFLGYLAQNANKPASQIPAFVSSAYDAGVLKAGVDPQFPNNVQGLVQSINYLFKNRTPQCYFGWQMNLWASPAGGWTTPVPGTGLMHLSDGQDVTAARTKIYNEAKAITQYYLNAGITSNGANFVSIDKYGLDAGLVEANAAQNPASSTWFWNADQWTNYLTFVRAMHETAKLPIVLWQLPVGHINTSTAMNPYNANKPFPVLTNSNRQGEDSAGSFFFGDEFTTTGVRLDFFSQNRGKDAGNYSSQNSVVWGEHFSAASQAGVSMALFGAGVGASTTNLGGPPSDSYWWIVKAQKYLSKPVG